MCWIYWVNFLHRTDESSSLDSFITVSHAEVKINSIVKLSGIDWVWNCNQTATITLNQIDTTKINDVYKPPRNSVEKVILLVLLVVYYGRNVILAHYSGQGCIFRATICTLLWQNLKATFIKLVHVRFIFKAALTRSLRHSWAGQLCVG